MSYTRKQVDELRAELFRLAPDHKFMVEPYIDYGWAIHVYDGQTMTEHEEPPIVVVACQPLRIDIGQPEVFRSAEKVIEILNERRDNRAQGVAVG